ncbi:MAG TPA: endo-1,4-beta-xylanase [Acidobacteriaceae bacterium]|nr:endo-1,4-beta-xylanase [Acidobacteriaceae bacterium]
MLTRRRFLTGGAAVAAILSGAGGSSAERTRFQEKGLDDAEEDAAISGSGSLRAHAAAHGLLTGAAIEARMLSADPALARLVVEQYSILVAENSMKWQALRPAPDRFDFGPGDALVAFAASHNIKMRGHNLVWHNALPAWFASTVTRDNARQFLVEHIATVAGHFRGKLQSWDVVNEAVLPEDGRQDGLRKSPWMELLGPDYIAIAYRAAREADPAVRLTYNDYGVEYDNDEDARRREAVLNLLRKMRGEGVPLDAVGIQSHIHAGSPHRIGRGLREFMRSVREMGLAIYITELDVNEDDLPYNDPAERDRTIAQTYRDYLGVALSEPAVATVLTWGITDRHTWLNSGPTHHRKQPDRPQRSLPFDAQLRPKEAFYAMRDSFDQRGQPES